MLRLLWPADPCKGTGQDGEIQAGVPWPNPRFTDNEDGTVTDHLTGLIWLKNGNPFGTRNWDQALKRLPIPGQRQSWPDGWQSGGRLAITECQ